MKTVLVTGANRGLGLEFVRQYAADGWQVEATGRSSSAELEQLVQQHPDLVHPRSLDVTDPASIAALAATLAGKPIDVLLNNAGYMGRESFADPEAGIAHQRFGNSDFADWEMTFRVNVLGPMRIAEALAANVERSEEKKIITLSSMVGSITLNTTGGLYAYRASKAAVNSIMKSMSIDLGKRGILAAAIHPGWVRTDMGGQGAQIEVDESVRGVRKVIAGLSAEQLGQVLAWDGSVLPY